MAQINADPKGNLYSLKRKKIGQETVHGSKGYNTTGPKGKKSVKNGTGVRKGCSVSQILIEIKTSASEKKPKATKCSDDRTISITAHTAKVVATILSRRIERKNESVSEEDKWILGGKRSYGCKRDAENIRINFGNR
jgi:hypothetical protein